MTTTAAVSRPGGLTATDTMIEVEDMRKAFGPVQALASVSLHAQAGRVLGLLGPNRAGKTTLSRCRGEHPRADAPDGPRQ